jgi:hypothetical protein
VQRPVPQRRAGQAARPGRGDLRRVAGQAVPGHGGVGGDDAGQAQVQRQVGDRVDLVVGQVRGDLDQQRDRAAARRGQRVAHGGEDRAQPIGLLQLAEPGRVRRAHVDHQVVRGAGQQPRARGVVGRRLLVRHRPGLADVRPDREAAPAAGAQPGRGGGRAVVVEAHPVDQGAVGGQPEHPRPGVARLGPRGQGADFDEPEAERAERVRRHGVLVEPRGQPERPGQVAPEGPYPQHGVGRREPPAQHPARAGDQRGGADEAEPQPVRGLCRHAPQHQREQQVVHGLSLAAAAARADGGSPGAASRGAAAGPSPRCGQPAAGSGGALRSP